MEGTSSTSQVLAHLLQQWKHPPVDSPTHFYPTPCYKPTKTSFLVVAIAPVHFYLNFMLFARAGHANFDFNQCSIFTECCFYLWKRLKWSKSLFLRFPPPDKVIHPSKISLPHPHCWDSPPPFKAIWRNLLWNFQLVHELPTMKVLSFCAFLLFSCYQFFFFYEIYRINIYIGPIFKKIHCIQRYKNICFWTDNPD